MCLYSMEASTRRINEGETVTVGKVKTYHGGEVIAAVPEAKMVGKRKQKKTGCSVKFACVCLKTNDELLLSELPADFMNQHALVSDTATVTFREGNGKENTLDRVEFVNTEVVPFAKLPIGTKLRCLARAENRVTVAQPAKVMKPTTAQPESEMVLVGASCVHAGVLATARRNPVLTGIGTGLLGLVLMLPLVLR